MIVTRVNVHFLSKIPGAAQYSSLEWGADVEVNVEDGETPETAMDRITEMMKAVAKKHLVAAKRDQFEQTGGYRG